VDHVPLFRNHPQLGYSYRVHEQILPGGLGHFCCSWPAVRYDGAIGPSDMWAMLTDRFTEKSEENP